MEKRRIVEFYIALFLIICGAVTMVLPLFNIVDVKRVFILLMALYGISHLVKNFLTLKSEEYSGFGVALSSIVILIVMMFVDIDESAYNLALILFIWIVLMSLNKLKESDYYHDRKNKLWKLNLFNLLLFILIGLLTCVSLSHSANIQILILGFFFFIHGVLEMMDPLVAYIIKNK